MDCAGVRNGEGILDVCTGTGDIAIRFAGADGTSRIYGVDQSEEMLRIARRKIGSSRLEGRIELLEANALHLPFRDDSFALVCIGFGLRNLGEHNRSVAEMVRVLKKDGRLMILEFSPPPRTLFGALYRLHLKTMIRAVGGTVSGCADAYRHLSTSITGFPQPKEIMRIMREEGLKEVASERLTGGVAYIYRGTK